MKTLKITLPAASPTLNVLLRSHYYKKRKELEKWGWLIRKATDQQRNHVPKPIVKCTIHVERYSTGNGVDWDGFYGGLKPILDCLVVPTAKNPNGLGFILDDNPKVLLALTGKQSKCKKGDEKTVVYIREVDE